MYSSWWQLLYRERQYDVRYHFMNFLKKGESGVFIASSSALFLPWRLITALKFPPRSQTFHHFVEADSSLSWLNRTLDCGRASKLEVGVVGIVLERFKKNWIAIQSTFHPAAASPDRKPQSPLSWHLLFFSTSSLTFHSLVVWFDY